MLEGIEKMKLLGLAGLLVILLLGCTAGTNTIIDPDDESSEEGGVIGTGDDCEVNCGGADVRLEGTVTDVRRFASNTLQIKSSTGELSSAVITDNGRYSAPSVNGKPPYLLRADLGNNEYRYGIAFGTERTNVNSHTDVILRNWFSGNEGDLDVEFDQQTPSTALPSQEQFNNNADRFFDLISLVLESYNISGEQILTGDYDTGTFSNGIYNYLRSNSMLIQDDTVSFVITDPTSETQSIVRTGFSLFELTAQPDTELPETPGEVRAFASAPDEIVIVWSPSNDNSGVMGYQVLRDGVPIATTPYPVLTDKGLESNKEYTYQIIAIDNNDNLSAPSLTATSDTLAEPDNTAPVAPVMLSVNSLVGRIELIWAVPSNIGEIVRFEVRRGGDGDPVESLTFVSGTIFTDLSVSSGVDYCYQIFSYDASGNPSKGSDEVCTTTNGEQITSVDEQLLPKLPPLAGLNITNTESMACTNNWSRFVLDSNMRVEADCYLVSETIVINNGGSLSLDPGVVMKFGAGTGIVINTGGSFSAEGTNAEPVVLTAQDPTPGYWTGLNFIQSNSSRNELFNTVVEYAGGGENAAAVALTSPTDLISRIDISGSVIRNCAGAGVRADSDMSKINRLDGTVISNCEVPLDVHIMGLSGITQRNEFSGNSSDVIDLRAAEIDLDMQLTNLGIPYVVNGIRVSSGNLKILDGVEIQFRYGEDFRVLGSVTIEGRADSRVKLTGTVKERGHWGVIFISKQAILKYVDIEYGGFGNNRGWDTANVMVGTGSLSLSDVLISHSSALAIHMFNPKGRITSINNLSLEGNSKSIRLGLSQLNQLGNQLDLSLNDDPTIELTTANLSDVDVDLLNFGTPYLLTTTTLWENGSFRIHPGVTLNMDDGVSLDILNGSSFSSVGTAELPITITHKSQFPGAWSGIYISSNSNLNRIEHSKIAFAGASNGTTAAAIRLQCEPQAKLFIANSAIEDSAGWGIASGPVGCELTLGDNVQFNRNLLGDMVVE